MTKRIEKESGFTGGKEISTSAFGVDLAFPQKNGDVNRADTTTISKFNGAKKKNCCGLNNGGLWQRIKCGDHLFLKKKKEKFNGETQARDETWKDIFT